MRAIWLPTRLALVLLAGISGEVHAEACLVHSQSDRVDVKVCQENLNIPPKLFHDGFCQPQLKDQKVDVVFSEQCPAGSFGQCSNAQVANMPYRQNIHYYGVASDAAFLKPFCEQQSQGIWKP
jgi:hypothetical protein